MTINQEEWTEALMHAIVCGLSVAGPHYAETVLAEMDDLSANAQAMLRAAIKAAEGTA